MAGFVDYTEKVFVWLGVENNRNSITFYCVCIAVLFAGVRNILTYLRTKGYNVYIYNNFRGAGLRRKDPISMLEVLEKAGKTLPLGQVLIGREAYFVAGETDEQVWLIPNCSYKWKSPIPPKYIRDEFLARLSEAENSGSPKRLAEILREGQKDKIEVYWQTKEGVDRRGLVRPSVVGPTVCSKRQITMHSRTGAQPQLVIEDICDENQ